MSFPAQLVLASRRASELYAWCFPMTPEKRRRLIALSFGCVFLAAAYAVMASTHNSFSTYLHISGHAVVVVVGSLYITVLITMIGVNYLPIANAPRYVKFIFDVFFLLGCTIISLGLKDWKSLVVGYLFLLHILPMSHVTGLFENLGLYDAMLGILLEATLDELLKIQNMNHYLAVFLASLICIAAQAAKHYSEHVWEQHMVELIDIHLREQQETNRPREQQETNRPLGTTFRPRPLR